MGTAWILNGTHVLSDNQVLEFKTFHSLTKRNYVSIKITDACRATHYGTILRGFDLVLPILWDLQWGF